MRVWAPRQVWSYKANHTTALYWEYDSRLGRRWNVDPVDQINLSRYSLNGNNPIVFSDPDGDLFCIPGLGSTSEQRQAAKAYQDAYGGKTERKWHKDIHNFKESTQHKFVDADSTPGIAGSAQKATYFTPYGRVAGNTLDPKMNDVTDKVLNHYAYWQQPLYLRDKPFGPLDYEQLFIPILPKGLKLFGRGTGLLESVAKEQLEMKTLGGASSSLKYYTRLSKEMGYASKTMRRTPAGVFVQINHNVNNLMLGKPMKVLYSNQEVTIIGRMWQNQAIGTGTISIGLQGATIYNFMDRK